MFRWYFKQLLQGNTLSSCLALQNGQLTTNQLLQYVNRFEVSIKHLQLHTFSSHRFKHLKPMYSLDFKPRIVASRHIDISSRPSLRGVSAMPPQYELLDISPAKHYDSFYYILRCCVPPPGRFPVIWAEPDLLRRLAEKYDSSCVAIPLLPRIKYLARASCVH